VRYFWFKEVDPGSSRSNSTNIYFSKWVRIHGTVPKVTDTVDTIMRTFLQRTSDPELYATVYIPELQISAQPLIYAHMEHGKLQHSSVDHISNIVRHAICDKQMGTMMTAHIRGASVSKIVQLAPSLTDQALALGRWTTQHTFRNHYQAPVLGTWAPLPKSLLSNPQQVLRWGWTPTPPDNVSVAEYFFLALVRSCLSAPSSRSPPPPICTLFKCAKLSPFFFFSRLACRSLLLGIGSWSWILVLDLGLGS
jgi:hypothetical protein